MIGETYAIGSVPIAMNDALLRHTTTVVIASIYVRRMHHSSVYQSQMMGHAIRDIF